MNLITDNTCSREMLRKFQTYLTELSYPNINLMSEEQIPDIFHPDNRIFLLSWIIEQLNPPFYEQLKEAKNVESLIADFIYEGGFCASTEKEMFVKADPTLLLVTQIQIIEKMLLFLKNLKITDTTNSVKKDISLDEIGAFMKSDVNIFPSIGPLKCRALNDRKHYLESYQSELEELKAKLGALEETSSSNVEDSKYDVHINESLKMLQTHSSDLHNNVMLLEHKQGGCDTPVFKLNVTKDVIQACDDTIKSLTKMTQDVDSIVNNIKKQQEGNDVIANSKDKKYDDVFTEFKSLRQYL